MAVAGLTVAAAVAGCGPSPTTISKGSKAIDAVLTNGKNFGTFVAEVHPTPGTLHDAAAGLADVSGDALSIKSKLDKIYASEDPLGEAFVQATCAGLNEVADQHRPGYDVLPPSAQEWEDFLNQRVAVYAPPQYADLIPGRVTQFNNAAELATINPNAARVYVEACVLGRR